MRISSRVFEDGGKIPTKYTCDGEDISPPLEIEDIPPEAERLALVVDDPDAPGTTFDHWIIWNIPGDVSSIPEDIPKTEDVESLGNADQGSNDFGEIGYRGPCPPAGAPHNYRFKLYALESEIDLPPRMKKSDLERKMEGQLIEKDQIVGIYSR